MDQKQIKIPDDGFQSLDIPIQSSSKENES